MKAQKITLHIDVEVLSVDTISGMLCDLASNIDKEFTSGELIADDGDTIKWSIDRKDIVF